MNLSFGDLPVLPRSAGTTLFSCGESSRENFVLVRRQPYEAGSAYSPADTLILTPYGESLLQEKPALQVWREVWACSGKAKHRKAAPNCERACGGIGLCLEGCGQSAERFHDCQFRYEVTATLSDVANNRRCVSTQGARLRRRLLAPVRVRGGEHTTSGHLGGGLPGVSGT